MALIDALIILTFPALSSEKDLGRFTVNMLLTW